MLLLVGTSPPRLPWEDSTAAPPPSRSSHPSPRTEAALTLCGRTLSAIFLLFTLQKAQRRAKKDKYYTAALTGHLLPAQWEAAARPTLGQQWVSGDNTELCMYTRSPVALLAPSRPRMGPGSREGSHSSNASCMPRGWLRLSRASRLLLQPTGLGGQVPFRGCSVQQGLWTCRRRTKKVCKSTQSTRPWLSAGKQMSKRIYQCGQAKMTPGGKVSDI